MYFLHYQAVSYAYVIFVNATAQIGKLTIHDQMDHVRCKDSNLTMVIAILN